MGRREVLCAFVCCLMACAPCVSIGDNVMCVMSVMSVWDINDLDCVYKPFLDNYKGYFINIL